MSCSHENIVFEGSTLCLKEKATGQVTDYRLDIEARCADCGAPFQFVGLPKGWRSDRPTTNIKKTEVRLPLKPA